MSTTPTTTLGATAGASEHRDLAEWAAEHAAVDELDSQTPGVLVVAHHKTQTVTTLDLERFLPAPRSMSTAAQNV